MNDRRVAIEDALRAELDTPIRGQRTAGILNAVGFEAIASPFLDGAAQKLELTCADHAIHDFAMVVPNSRHNIAFRCLVHPGTVREATASARDDLYASASHVSRLGAKGLVHMTVFAGGPSLELRCAWLPLPDANFVDPVLPNPVIPWREPAPAEAPDPPRESSSLIDLARATHVLTGAMRHVLDIWPDAAGSVRRPGLPKVREALTSAVTAFNEAAQRARLEHRMPLSVYDATWLPHNIRNALEFESIRATLASELFRSWGPEAADAFRKALGPFVQGDPDSSTLREIATLRNLPGPPSSTPAPAERLDVFVCYTWVDKTRGARDIMSFSFGKARPPGLTKNSVQPMPRSISRLPPH